MYLVGALFSYSQGFFLSYFDFGAFLFLDSILTILNVPMIKQKKYVFFNLIFYNIINICTVIDFNIECIT